MELTIIDSNKVDMYAQIQDFSSLSKKMIQKKILLIVVAANSDTSIEDIVQD